MGGPTEGEGEEGSGEYGRADRGEGEEGSGEYGRADRGGGGGRVW